MVGQATNREFGKPPQQRMVHGSLVPPHPHRHYVCCSPCFKLKPVSKGVKSGYAMVNVEPYGGLLQHTWFDRDLSLAGRMLVRTGESSMRHVLVRRSGDPGLVLGYCCCLQGVGRKHPLPACHVGWGCRVALRSLV